MGVNRTEKIARFLQKEISLILVNKIKDKRIRHVAVTEVNVSKDLNYAKIFCEVYIDSDDKEFIISLLEKSKGFIRKEIAKSATFKRIPELTFILDRSKDNYNKIDNILKKLNLGTGETDNEV